MRPSSDAPVKDVAQGTRAIVPLVGGGDMVRYDWRMNGQVYGQYMPLHVTTSKRIEIVGSVPGSARLP